ncbi:glycosyltransferase [Sphingobacteruim zhuxiongii]|uniref:glycosyltransferase n=1 Tax=Sphingobacterium zhuxiongii TaxID=2662364 RepID=UPI0013662390|nr:MULTISPECIES: glycosyltransferase [unclassified Sphingobacterium]
MPRKCGIATFSHDLYKSLAAQGVDVSILAVSNGTEKSFPKEVKYKFLFDLPSEYLRAAEWIATQNYDCCILQHEFGLFAGEAGKYILDLLRKIQIPVISNLHTVLENPSASEREVIENCSKLSTLITVMTTRAVNVLLQNYGIPKAKVRHIPHGVPDFQISAEDAREVLGLEGKIVMLSFGLLGRSKGYEVAIDAVSQIKEENFIYIILGTTHPNVYLQEGDSYKQELIQRAASHKLTGKVRFVDKFASDTLLQTYLKACDIYVTPYPDANQMSSGTLSFALGAGAAVISTPYAYAKDLLAQGRGCFFDFNDSDGLAYCIKSLINNSLLMNSYRNKALVYGKKMSWSNVGKQQLMLVKEVVAGTNSLSQMPRKNRIRKTIVLANVQNRSRIGS